MGGRKGGDRGEVVGPTNKRKSFNGVLVPEFIEIPQRERKRANEGKEEQKKKKGK